MPYRNGPFDAATDPRLLRVHVERAAKALRGTAASSPVWAAFMAFMSCETVGFFGHVPLVRAGLVLAIICTATLAIHAVLGRFYGRDAAEPVEKDRRWMQRFQWLSIGVSIAWGAAPWLLWDEANLVNHLFIELICLAMVARILVNRANHLPFFLATFVPAAGLLLARNIMGADGPDLVLAALVPLYGIQVAIDSLQISQRWDAEVMVRFSFQDMSRELEEARDEALGKRAEAEAANASKTSFLANMSHELRTPLNAILGFSEIIERECLGPVGSPRYKEYAGDIHTSGRHLLSLINDLLDVAKIEAGKMEIEPQMIETQRTLENALKFVAVKAREKGQALSISVEDDAAILFADERALKQVVINLGSNATKFTPSGGRIEVRARRCANGDFELSVADNGPGIPRDRLDHIFKPFARVDNRYDSEASGTGLGLALVRGLVDLHGGRAWIESDEGRGTTVFVVLPMRVLQGSPKKRAQA